jgi:hypothetical protein
VSLRSTAGLVVITVVCLLGPLVARAYGTAEALPRFWTGALLLVVAPLPLAASIGLGVTVAFASATAAWLSICAAGLGAFTIAVVDATAFGGSPSVAVIAIAGIVSILGWTPPAWLALLLGLATGAVAATASNAGMQHWDAALGLGAMVIVISGWTAKSLRYARTFPQLEDVVPVARRVIGAWGTAIALLLARSP